MKPYDEIAFLNDYPNFLNLEKVTSLIQHKRGLAIFIDVFGCLLLNGNEYNKKLEQSVGSWYELNSVNGITSINVIVWSTDIKHALPVANHLSNNLVSEVYFCEKNHLLMRYLNANDILIDDDDITLRLGRAYGIKTYMPDEFIKNISNETYPDFRG